MTSPTETIIAALRVLARDIQSNDGIANAAIAEAAYRLEEQQERIKRLEDAGESIVVEKLRRELEDERKRADRLSDDVKRLEDQVKLYHDENASLRDTLANEREQAAGLRLGLEMLGKEMGWAR